MGLESPVFLVAIVILLTLAILLAIQYGEHGVHGLGKRHKGLKPTTYGFDGHIRN
ncbi:hypothetical protein [Vulcanisaeta sp. EB80]|uniref:hypothetical protein n=1 Tax=Vulcanisaeta sp. EB80 TaxID=1650660 RepID=UPI00138A3C2E|nr:hypothetical protein [Vulcanisaeta sp. EB80]